MLKIILPLLAGIILYKLIIFIIKIFIFKPLELKEDVKKKVLQRIRIILRIILILTLLLVFLNFFGPDLFRIFKAIGFGLAEPFYTTGSTNISIITVLLIIPIIYLGTWGSKLAKSFINKTLKKNATLSVGSRFTISILFRNGIMILTILLGLSTIGIDLTAIGVFFGVLGALGLGLGFGLQNVVSNFFAGIVLIFERPIKEGDRINVQGIDGDVVHIRFRSTVINTLTNETIIVPNSKLVDDSIHNYSYSNPKIIVINTICVSYSTNIHKARDVLLSINEENPYAILSSENEVRILSFKDYGIELELRTWIKKAYTKFEAKSWINYKIWEKFQENEIKIPFPQIELHMRKFPTITTTQINK